MGVRGEERERERERRRKTEREYVCAACERDREVGEEKEKIEGGREGGSVLGGGERDKEQHAQ